MLKGLTLPKGAKEELNYPSSIAEKILNGLPLWEEEKKNEDDGDEEAEHDDTKDKKQLT